jgi:hypothetical protein
MILELDELWRIGGYAERDEEVFGTIVQVLCDSRFNVYILDSQLNTLKKFSSNGDHVAQIGREGDGPGEFRGPVSAFFLPDGDIGVLCRQGIRRFSPDGEARGSYPLPEHEMSSGLVRARTMRDGLVYCRLAMDRHETGYDATTFLGKSNQAGQEIARFAEQRISRTYASFVLEENNSNDWQTRWEIGPQDRVYVSREFTKYEIQVWSSDGVLESVIRREYEPLERSRDELAHAHKRWAAAIRSRRGARAEVSPTHRAIIHVFPRPDGTLWVLSSRGARETEIGQLARFDVFDNGGRFRREVTLTGQGDSLRDRLYFFEDRLFVVVGDSENDDEQDLAPNTVLCYRVDPWAQHK